jgi:arylsulfatase A-like enzyme
MFTGLYPSQHGTHEGNLTLSENIQHLVPVLKMAGYRTLGISSNLLVNPASGLCRGFDEFTGFGKHKGFGPFAAIFNPAEEIAEQRIASRIAKAANHKERIKLIFKYFIETGNYREGLKDICLIAKHMVNKVIAPNPFQKSSKYTKKTVKLLRTTLREHFSTRNGQPFFFFINFVEPHELYKPPLMMRRFSRWYDKQYRRVQSLYNAKDDSNRKKINDLHINLYDDEVLFLDYAISQIWEAVKQYPAFEDTVFIITSDHGEHFGEKGLYAHSFSLYNELIRVPLLVKFPQALNKKGFSDKLVSLTDLYATILDLVGSPLPRPKTSVSLLNGANRDFVLSQLINPFFWSGPFKAKEESCRREGQDFSPPRIAAITAGGKKIIERDDGGLEMYDLTQDMDEMHNLAGHLSSEAKENLINLLTYLKEETGYPEAVKQLDSTKLTDNTYDF